MQFKSFEEIIGFAIEKEKEAAAFYEEAAGQGLIAGINAASCVKAPFHPHG